MASLKCCVGWGFVSGKRCARVHHDAASSGAGCQSACGHNASHLGRQSRRLFVSNQEHQPEYAEAKRRGIPGAPRRNVADHALKYGIGIAGTHGKTSTTSMVGTILMAANLDPTIIVGGKWGDWAAMPNWVRANFRG